MLSLTLREARRDVTRNLAPAELPAWLGDALRTGFTAALLETTRRDWQLAPAERGRWRLVAHPPRRTVPGFPAHDRPPGTVLDGFAQDWLHALGLTDKNGGVVPRAAAKHRQVRRFAEILHGLVEQADWRDGRPVRVLDAGCGKGYLTFAVWHLLRREFGCAADVLGVEARAGLVDFCRGVAGALGLEGLRFAEGTIATVPPGPLDLLIALHACNTATDDAIRRGIAGRAGIILVAPCCHQEVRPRLGRPAPLAPALAHGLFAERMAEWVTDALRMLFLEWAGYRVRALEFVSLEHTAKNLLLAAVRKDPDAPFANPVALGRYQALKGHFGLGPLALDAPLAIGSPG
ncbi:MAG TPA: SAM-dependent methyltransferase [Verrucomicrobiota bacterium]|nr:SAM-dependent methyltransferase [Verrucomicrobiota bacterium]